MAGTLVCIGVNDHGHLLDGWHERERDGRWGVPFRAACERGIARVARNDKARELVCLMSGPRWLLGRTVAGTITINGERHPVGLSEDIFVIRRFPLTGYSAPMLDIVFELPDAVRPDDVRHNGDARRLGWYLSALWQE